MELNLKIQNTITANTLLDQLKNIFPDYTITHHKKQTSYVNLFDSEKIKMFNNGFGFVITFKKGAILDLYFEDNQEPNIGYLKYLILIIIGSLVSREWQLIAIFIGLAVFEIYDRIIKERKIYDIRYTVDCYRLIQLLTETTLNK
ncbi:MAG: hypothetical protein KA143_04215 [Saprospiraceae bacterium]|nr:hypothetical protein [Saprospiraceae bacterium]